MLKLSHPNLKFHFDDDNMDESLYQKIFIDNHCPADTYYNWEIPLDSNYSIEPLKDVVKIGQSKGALIKFTPEYLEKRGQEEVLTLNIENGYPVNLSCLGTFSEASCALQKSVINFGVVSVGIKAEGIVLVKNLLRTPAVFYVKKCPP
mmetsp:Transcript_16849/g.2757  ORF Transcript_16849/g.2757 Transcript_16849/m.2757 type:complete len:148 (+) Transcript_16849:1180-1623(+)